ncbi:MAG: NifB/NifX family molybdenum-iron cluster-binding protein [Phycisphaerae bacterium]|nr:NifB/NifX family molybdenum-iron cluster-binding protein [Phycisphaerae bacterium]
MKVAVPVQGGNVSMHFGHCEHFALFDVDEVSKQITGTTTHAPPPHEPGVLPQWLHELGADVIITGGMGARAQQLFAQHGINIVLGVTSGTPEEVVNAYASGALASGENACDH